MASHLDTAGASGLGASRGVLSAHSPSLPCRRTHVLPPRRCSALRPAFYPSCTLGNADPNGPRSCLERPSPSGSVQAHGPVSVAEALPTSPAETAPLPASRPPTRLPTHTPACRAAGLRRCCSFSLACCSPTACKPHCALTASGPTCPASRTRLASSLLETL